MRVLSFKTICFLLAIISPLSIAAKTSPQPAPCKDASTIYINATFITLNPNQQIAKAIAIKKHRIAAIGEQAKIISQCKGSDTKVTDLKGDVVTPGLINTYSHLMLYGWLANHAIDLSTTNTFQRQDWKPIKTTEEMLTALQAQEKSKKDWLIAYGYDEGRIQGDLLTQQKLDELGTSIPTMLIYSSGDKALLNAEGIKKIAADKSLKNVLVDYDGMISGLALDNVLKHIITKEQRLEAIKTATALFKQNGFTTIADVQIPLEWAALYDKVSQSSSLPFDLILSVDSISDYLKTSKQLHKNPRIYLAPFLIKLDGQIQNYKAYLTEPYINKNARFTAKWRGALLQPADTIRKAFKKSHKQNIPVMIEAHGDAAIDFALELIKTSSLKKGKVPATTLINMEYIREEQIKELKKQGVHASWFPSYLYYWGESACQDRLGPERAQKITPLKSAKIAFNSTPSHINVPASPPSAVDAMNWMTTRIVQRWNYPPNRTCPQYFNLEERISPEQALKSFTIDAAKLYGLEKEKGSLEVGKLADMSIFSANPLQEKGKPIYVTGIIVRGKLYPIEKNTVYKNKPITNSTRKLPLLVNRLLSKD